MSVESARGRPHSPVAAPAPATSRSQPRGGFALRASRASHRACSRGGTLGTVRWGTRHQRRTRAGEGPRSASTRASPAYAHQGARRGAALGGGAAAWSSSRCVRSRTHTRTRTPPLAVPIAVGPPHREQGVPNMRTVCTSYLRSPTLWAADTVAAPSAGSGASPLPARSTFNCAIVSRDQSRWSASIRLCSS